MTEIKPEYLVPKTERHIPERYWMDDGEDLIAKWEKNFSQKAFQAVLLSNIQRYAIRYGKKDKHLTEARKMLDYAKRLELSEKRRHGPLNDEELKAVLHNEFHMVTELREMSLNNLRRYLTNLIYEHGFRFGESYSYYLDACFLTQECQALVDYETEAEEVISRYTGEV